MKVFFISVLLSVLSISFIKVGAVPSTIYQLPSHEIRMDFDFENRASSNAGPIFMLKNKNVSYTKSFDGKALKVQPDNSDSRIFLKDSKVPLDSRHDFTVTFWVKTKMDNQKPSVILSTKEFENRGIAQQKKKGWTFYISQGVWAWNMGTGDRRLTHEYEIGETGNQILNDGLWHQLGIVYAKEKKEIRIFYDGDQKAIFSISDQKEVEFLSDLPLMIGSNGSSTDAMQIIHDEIRSGQQNLQNLVNEFNRLGVGNITDDQFETLIVEPKELLDNKLPKLSKEEKEKLLEPILKLRAKLHDSRYTVYQVRDFMRVAPLLRIYRFENGVVNLDKKVVDDIVQKERFFASDFEIDKLSISNVALTSDAILDSYKTYFKDNRAKLANKISKITVGNWNIHHGGKHNTILKDGWDSRVHIVEMLRATNVDVVLLQETYSSGAFIADQLGFYYASTIDRDYLYQGANIAVLSRFPIKEIYVPQTATFMNVAVKIAVDDSQDMYVMSNWYGMSEFPNVYEFHQKRFSEADITPTVFGGDFNAVPDNDGGKSLAATQLLNTGFKDTYRSLYPDVSRYPGYTHDSKKRIDQVYYKGKKIRNNATKIVADWDTGFPSDHYLIISEFDFQKQ